MDPRRRDPRYVVVLSIASVVILVGGWLVRPRATREAPVALPTETDLAQLARLAQRRSLDHTAGYLAGIAGDVAAAVVSVPDLLASAIVWDPQRLVTTRLPVALPPAAVGVRLDTATRETSVDRWGPNLPLATLTLRDPAPWKPLTRAPGLPAAGEWVVAVWRTAEAPVFAAGNYVERTAIECSLPSAHEIVSTVPLSRTMTGGGLVDLDGRLLAVILPCGDRLAALAATSIAELIAREATIPQKIHARLGLVVSVPLSEEAEYFGGVGGVMVRELWRRQQGDQAGFAAGDLIVAVNGTAVSGVDDLAPILASPVEVTVRRGSRQVVLTLPSAAAAQGEAAPATAGVIWESPPRSVAIGDVVADSRAARAGLEPGDRIVRVDSSEPRSLDHLQRQLRARRTAPVLIEVERDSRRLARWLPPEVARE